MARTVNVAEHAARRDAILDTAQRLILLSGYERLTVQDILDDQRISKGAFYYYFDSKPAVIEALTEKLVGDSERTVVPIVANTNWMLWTSCNAFSASLSVGSRAPEPFCRDAAGLVCARQRRLSDADGQGAVAERLGPLLTAIVRQGVDEQRFATTFPEQAGRIIVALIQALQDAMAGHLLAAADRSPDDPRVKEMVATYGAHVEAIERYLGISPGALYRADSRTIRSWIDALREVDTTVTEGTR